jgi:hypothetical protein
MSWFLPPNVKRLTAIRATKKVIRQEGIDTDNN